MRIPLWYLDFGSKKYNIRVVDIDCVVSGLASQYNQSVIADNNTISRSLAQGLGAVGSVGHSG